MKAFKSFIVLFCVMSMLCSFFTVNTSAATVTVSGSMKDTSDSDNGVVNWVLECNETTGNAKLTLSGDGYMPNYPGEDEISEIQYWYEDLYSSGCWITELVIEEGVRSISESAFSGEERLESVVLPDSLEFIGDSAFSGTAIKSVNIPSMVEDINGTMFSPDYIENYNVDENNIHLKSVDGVVYSWDMTTLKVFPVGRYANNHNYIFEIPETVTTIESLAFINGDAEAITIPGTVKNIKNRAFAGNIYLETLDIEEGVEHIYDSAFLSCTALKNVSIPSSVTDLGYLSFGFIPAVDYEGIRFIAEATIKEKGKENPALLLLLPIPEITSSNASFWVGFTPYTIDNFIYWETTDDFTITGLCNSKAEEYAFENGFAFIKNHETTDWIVDIEATCTEKGSKHKVCTRCGLKTEVTEIPEREHNYILGTVLESTCKEKGFEMWFCDVCYDSYMINYPLAEHTPGDWITDMGPTCTEKGYKHKNCTVCDIVLETEEIAENGHSAVVDEAVAPTCTEAGKTEGSHCSVCNEVIVAQNIVPTTGHTVSGWIIDTEPTCTQNGSRHKVCTVCGEVIQTQTMAKKGHTSSSWITDTKATVYKAGSKHKECTNCGETLETAKIAQLKPGRTTVKATTTSTGVKISWSKVTGADSYTVYRKTGSGSYKAIKTVTGTSYTDTTAKSGTKYTYNVKAKNEAGYGEYAKSGVSKLFLATPKVTVSNASTGVTVKWNKITGAKGYYVYRKTGSGSYTKIATIKSGSTVSYTDKKASAGKTYTYYVKAYNGDYVSSYKASTAIEFLKAPTLKSVTSGKSGVTVKWAKSTGADGYYVYRKEGSGEYKKLATVKGNSKVSYLDKNAKKGKTYTYYVKAYSGKSVSTSRKTLKIKDKY